MIHNIYIYDLLYKTTIYIYVHLYDLVCHFASYNVMISRRLMCGDMIWQMLREDDIGKSVVLFPKHLLSSMS